MEEFIVYGSTPYLDADIASKKYHNTQKLVANNLISIHQLHSANSQPCHTLKKSQLPYFSQSSNDSSRSKKISNSNVQKDPNNYSYSDVASISNIDVTFSRIICPVHNSSSLNVYTWNKESPDQVIVLPEKLSCIKSSPNISTAQGVENGGGEWLVGGSFSGRLYVWEVRSGNLVTVKDSHYQEITRLEFSKDGAFLFSTSLDGRVCGWRIVDLVREGSISATSDSANSGQQGSSNSDDITAIKPLFTWTNHILPVTGLCTGYGTAASGFNLYTSSLDNTVQIHRVDTSLVKLGDRSSSSSNYDLTFVFPCKVTSLAIDNADRALYVGLINGSIYMLNLYVTDSGSEGALNNSNEGSGYSIQSVFSRYNTNVITIDDSTTWFAKKIWTIDTTTANSTGSLKSNQKSNNNGKEEAYPRSVTSLCLSFDATNLVIGAANGLVSVLDIPTKTVVKTLPPRNGPISGLSLVHRRIPSKDAIQIAAGLAGGSGSSSNRGSKRSGLAAAFSGTSLSLTPNQLPNSALYEKLPVLKRNKTDKDALHDIWIKIPNLDLSGNNANFDLDSDFGLGSSAVEDTSSNRLTLKQINKQVAYFDEMGDGAEALLKERIEQLEKENKELYSNYNELATMHKDLWKLHSGY